MAWFHELIVGYGARRRLQFGLCFAACTMWV